MQSYDACRLIAVNLYSFVDNPFTNKANFNFKKFYEINYEAMRLSDDLIDLELEAIDRIIKKIESDKEDTLVKERELKLWDKIKTTASNSRRTGLGFTALGDTLAALNLKYDSDSALDIIDKIMSTKMESELDCTIDLSILRGHFEGWNPDLEYDLQNSYGELEDFGLNSFYEFIRTNFSDQWYKMQLHGRRNVSWSTVAPTGSVSILTQTTSGLEPLFMPYYMRRKKVNPGEEGVRVDFTDQNGDTWQEFPILHPKFLDWMEEKYVSDARLKQDSFSKKVLQQAFEMSPWYGSTANDINWVKRVEIQSIIQKYISHSISSTINLPEYVTENEVSEIYLEAWKQGLKGITVYRDGSRSGVLVDTSKPIKSNFEYLDAPKRPKELDAEAYVSKSGQVGYNVFVGLLDGKPYEIFIDPYSSIKGKGKIVKQKKGDYSFINEKDNINITIDISDEQAAITRLVSTSLRHGADIKFVVEQLSKCDGDLFSFTKSLARVLKKYIPDGAKSTVTCTDCGSHNVVFEEGCLVCKDCGSSKCG